MKVSHLHISVGILGISGGCSQGVAGASHLEVGWDLGVLHSRGLSEVAGDLMLAAAGWEEPCVSRWGPFLALWPLLVIGQTLGQGSFLKDDPCSHPRLACDPHSTNSARFPEVLLCARKRSGWMPPCSLPSSSLGEVGAMSGMHSV